MRARRHSPAGATAVYNETQYDSSVDESDPVSSDLESEDNDEDYFFYNSHAITMDTYSIKDRNNFNALP